LEGLGFFGLLLGFGDFRVISRVRGFSRLFLWFREVGVMFRSMASFDSDVLMDLGDYDNSFHSD
jgi:hypothetical protein